ncbi:MAG: phosphodiester glycosidase family protein [Chlamydiales bacterium]|nr:phosphodiester glycosidase family protein [Chlamydiales bacterium]
MRMPEGIWYEKRILEGPVEAHILEVDPARAQIELARAQFLQPTSEIAQQNGAFAAVNGGFFHIGGAYAGTPSGLLKIDGRYHSTPRIERGAIGWKREEGAPLFDRIGWSGTELIPILHPEKRDPWNLCSDCIGGTPLLIDDGHTITDFSPERTRPSFLTERHPRTAVGIKEDGHWLFVVVDGRQPTRSIGMTMGELANFMADLGATHALNLDGGGSSTFYLDGNVLNTPSSSSEDNKQEGSQRPVSDALLIFTQN